MSNNNRTRKCSYPSDPGGGGGGGGDDGDNNHRPYIMNQHNNSHYQQYDPTSFIHPSLLSTTMNNSTQRLNNDSSSSSSIWSLADSCDSIESSIPSHHHHHNIPSLLSSSMISNHHSLLPFNSQQHYHNHHHISHPSSKTNPAWIKVKQSSAKSPDILTRPSWFDAELALNQIEKGKANGNGTSLWLRFMIQARFFELGLWIQRKAGAIMFIASLILVVCLAGLKSVHIEDNVEKLWIEDGGRLEKELQYVRNVLGDGYGTTDQIVIQTPKNEYGTVLNSSALLFHLKVMRTAITTSVEMFDATWNLKDICYTPSSPYFDKHHLDSLLENIFPCSIITPLDCFWEGSKLLGPEIPVKIPGYNQQVQWTNLNPQQMVDIMITLMKQSIESSGATIDSNNQIDNNNGGSSSGINPILEPLETIRKFMKRAGITSAYQSKPCLDPHDLNCPLSAPNKQSGQSPNIGYELTDGCYGFATKYMHWIEDLIVGGIAKNRSGHIIRAKALQSIIQLMGEQNLFEYHQRTIKVQHVMDWSIDKARAILHAWQRKFSEELKKFMVETDFVGSQQYDVHHFTSASLTDIMRNFSQVNFFRLAIGYILMLLHAGLSLSRWRNKHHQRLERSQSILGMLGVLLIGLAVASGLGVCALIGLAFNATTTQIVPLLASGLSIDNMFLLAHLYTTDFMINFVPHQYRTAECLKQAGFNILLSSIGNIVAFCSAAIIPIPALRCFCLQTAILITFTSIAVIVLFPAIASIDLRFRSLYLQSTTITNTQQYQQVKTSSFLINMCFYLFCCRTPQFQQQQQQQQQQNNKILITSVCKTHPVSNLQQQSSQTSEITTESSKLSSSSLFKQPYQYKQPYNYAYLNSIQPMTNNHDNVKRNSSSSSKTTTTICRCQHRTTSFVCDNDNDVNVDDNEMIRQCNNCGGDLRTQCDGQNNDDHHEEFQETTPIAPSLSSDPKPQIFNKIQSDISSLKPSTIKLFKFSTTHVIEHYIAPVLKRRPIKVLVLLCYLVLIVISVIGITKVNDGLDLTDIVPHGTNEYRFLELRRQYFSYYNIFAVTKGNFDYPNGQRLLYDYHQTFNRIGAIIKNDDGGLPDFWLPMFRDWLKELQDAFDYDRKRGCITRERWYPNATSESILAYKLLVQTGRPDNPVDKSLLLSARLVDSQGIINPKAFYNYLTAWVSNDVMSYGASQAAFKPEPRQWIHETNDVELKIPKSPPLIFTQIPFNLNNIRSTEEIVQTIQDVRMVCQRFEERGLPNFPTGIPFTYWEQYLGLRFYMIVALLAVLIGIFFATLILTCSLWTPMIIVAHLVVNVMILFGFIGWIGIKLSALPAVILIVSIGISLNPLIHITISFNTALGNRNQRMSMALQHMANPVLHGIVSTLFGLIMLSFSEFDFIIRYFFMVLGASILIITINSFILLPIILSIIGPKSELQSLEHEDRISTPSPPPSPIILPWPPLSINQHNHHHSNNGGIGGHSSSNDRYIEALMLETAGIGRRNGRKSPSLINRTPSSLFNRYRQQRKELQRMHSQLSLSTISEEPSSYQSTPTPTTTPIPHTLSTPSSSQQSQPTTNIATIQPAAAAQPIVVHPEFVVETTITNNNNNPKTSTTPTSEIGSTTTTDSPSPSMSTDDNNSRCESSNSIASSSTTTVTTKVMATAKLQIELHPYTPSPTPSTIGSTTPSTTSMSNPHTQYQHPMVPTMVSFPGANYHHYQPIFMSQPPPSYHHNTSHNQQTTTTTGHEYHFYPGQSVTVNHPHHQQQQVRRFQQHQQQPSQSNIGNANTTASTYQQQQSSTVMNQSTNLHYNPHHHHYQQQQQQQWR
ncbi:Protein patched 1 [Dermatophagoides farinae]|uniref:Protein patched 1 n=1 Tax=Dermatophagoides farinae TaxID=6954 RepID=A0A922HVL5_DERFA|nr:Protein patched 1 [Dermatophagoides farinae]